MKTTQQILGAYNFRSNATGSSEFTRPYQKEFHCTINSKLSV